MGLKSTLEYASLILPTLAIPIDRELDMAVWTLALRGWNRDLAVTREATQLVLFAAHAFHNSLTSGKRCRSRHLCMSLRVFAGA
jgi:hypothetical protein